MPPWMVVLASHEEGEGVEAGKRRAVRARSLRAALYTC